MLLETKVARVLRVWPSSAPTEPHRMHRRSNGGTCRVPYVTKWPVCASVGNLIPRANPRRKLTSLSPRFHADVHGRKLRGRPGRRETKLSVNSFEAPASSPYLDRLDSNRHWSLRDDSTLRHVRSADRAGSVARRAIVRHAAMSRPVRGAAAITSVRGVRPPARGRTVGCRMLR